MSIGIGKIDKRKAKSHRAKRRGGKYDYCGFFFFFWGLDKYLRANRFSRMPKISSIIKSATVAAARM